MGNNHKIICDYLVQTIITDEEKLDTLLSKFNVLNDLDKDYF